MPSCDDQAPVFSERVWSRRTKSHYASCWNRRTWTLLRVMRSCFDKTRIPDVRLIWNLKHVRASHLASDLGAGRRMRSRCWSVEKSQKRSLPAKKATGKKSNFHTLATGSCLTLSSFGNKKKLRKKEWVRSTQWATIGASFVGQVVWNTEPVRFFSLGHFVFFPAHPRRFGEKKVTRNIEKKAHGLTSLVDTMSHTSEDLSEVGQDQIEASIQQGWRWIFFTSAGDFRQVHGHHQCAWMGKKCWPWDHQWSRTWHKESPGLAQFDKEHFFGTRLPRFSTARHQGHQSSSAGHAILWSIVFLFAESNFRLCVNRNFNTIFDPDLPEPNRIFGLLNLSINKTNEQNIGN